MFHFAVHFLFVGHIDRSKNRLSRLFVDLLSVLIILSLHCFYCSGSSTLPSLEVFGVPLHFLVIMLSRNGLFHGPRLIVDYVNF